jgi:hypothetical protein
MRDLERWKRLEGELKQRAEAKGLFTPGQDNPHEGMTLPELLGLVRHFTGDLILNELRAFAADSTMSPDEFIDSFFSIVEKLQTKGDALALTDQGDLRTIQAVQLADLKAEVKRALRSRRLDPLPDLLHLPADRIVKSTFDAFLPGNMREANNMGFFGAYSYSWRSSKTNESSVKGIVGYRDNPGEAIWDYTQHRGSMLAKLQLNLWARAYAETSARAGEFIELSILQLCDDLGYKRKKGGHRREVKLEVSQALNCLWELEVEARFQVEGKSYNVKGPLWSEGLRIEQSEDLFENIPYSVRFAPGDWFNTPAWRSLNKQVAAVSAGALKLSTEKNDQAALFLACYFSTLARMNHNRPFSRLKADTLAEKSGLKQTYTRPGRLREAVERALDRLIEVGVIKNWRLDTVDPCADPDDLDNPETLATLADDGSQTKRNWLSQVYVIEWPDEVVETGPAIAKGIAKAKRLSARAGKAGSRSKGKA